MDEANSRGRSPSAIRIHNSELPYKAQPIRLDMVQQMSPRGTLPIAMARIRKHLPCPETSA
ncbi:hypothetical protein Syun_029302 [Stephania yunnanensis]|uniref:Uncharacterized protein n=1 Tax=Stephania yunnanensis TaxID=152371 RepID=A0AAP0HFW5_9MAGN